MKKISIIYLFLLIFGSFQLFASDSDYVLVSVPVTPIKRDRVAAIPYSGTAFPTFSLWLQECNKSKKNRDGAQAQFDSGFKSLGTKEQQWQEFYRVLSAWFEMMVSGPLKIERLWEISNFEMQTKPSKQFYDVKNLLPEFTPYAQKIIAEPGDQFFIRGDLHGDIFSLLAQLNKMHDEGVIDDNFRIIKDNIWVLFLGDYVDRGQYGCEVLYTMMRLALANPDRVIFVRGNHEDIGISAKNGFKEEVMHKFDDTTGFKHKTISRMNDLLPVVLYLGCQDLRHPVNSEYQVALSQFQTNYLQCCHGGLEIGYNPRPFLDNHATSYQFLGVLHQLFFIQKFILDCDQKIAGMVNWFKSFMHSNPYKEKKNAWIASWMPVEHLLKDDYLLNAPTNEDGLALGFMWNDFDVADLRSVQHYPGRGLIFGQDLTQQILELQSSTTSKICGVFRAHQHGDPDMMHYLNVNKGVYKLWRSQDNAVARNCADEKNYRTLQGGKVWTFNVGADSVYGQNFGFNFDAYARLIVQQNLNDWKLYVFNTQVITK